MQFPGGQIAYRTAVFRPLKLKSSRSSSRRNGRGNAYAFGLPPRGRRLDRRAAGIRQPEHAGHLVEGLAGGVVDRAAEQSKSSGPRQRYKLECPPLTISPTQGNTSRPAAIRQA